MRTYRNWKTVTKSRGKPDTEQQHQHKGEGNGEAGVAAKMAWGFSRPLSVPVLLSVLSLGSYSTKEARTKPNPKQK